MTDASYPEHDTMDNVLAWVGTDPERARQALAIEEEGRKRPTLVEQLQPIAAPPSDDDTVPPDTGTDQGPTGATAGAGAAPGAQRTTSATGLPNRNNVPAANEVEPAEGTTDYDQRHAGGVVTEHPDPDAASADVANRDRRDEHTREMDEGLQDRTPTGDTDPEA